MPNPNPSPKTRFKTDRDEPLTSQLALKVSASFEKRLKKQKNWQEFVRITLAKALEEKETEQDLTSA